MKHILSFILPVLGLLAVGCSSDDIAVVGVETTSESVGFTSVGNPVEVTLDLTALPFDEYISTRVETPVEYELMGEVEKAAYDYEQRMLTFWIFEYDYETHELIHEPYYDRSTSYSGSRTFTSFTLSDNLGKPVILYAVVNALQGVVAAKDWVTYDETTGTYPGFMTLEELEAQEFPTEYEYATQPSKTEIYTDDNGNLNSRFVYQDWPPYYCSHYENQAKSTLYIPKCGYIGGDGELKITNGGSINIPVTNLYAKIMMYAIDEHFSTGDYYCYNFIVENIPCYSRIAPLGNAETYDVTDVIYPDTTRWTYTGLTANNGYHVSNYLSDNTDAKYIVYVPENFQGESGSESSSRDENAPQSRMTSKKYDDPTTTSSSYKLTGVSSKTDALAVHYYSWDAKQYFGPLYPGGNTTTNFNVRRNCTYLVTFNLELPAPDNDVIVENEGTEGYFDNVGEFDY